MQSDIFPCLAHADTVPTLASQPTIGLKLCRKQLPLHGKDKDTSPNLGPEFIPFCDQVLSLVTNTFTQQTPDLLPFSWITFPLPPKPFWRELLSGGQQVKALPFVTTVHQEVFTLSQQAQCFLSSSSAVQRCHRIELAVGFPFNCHFSDFCVEKQRLKNCKSFY